MSICVTAELIVHLLSLPHLLLSYCSSHSDSERKKTKQKTDIALLSSDTQQQPNKHAVETIVAKSDSAHQVKGGRGRAHAETRANDEAGDLTSCWSTAISVRLSQRGGVGGVAGWRGRISCPEGAETMKTRRWMPPPPSRACGVDGASARQRWAPLPPPPHRPPPPSCPAERRRRTRRWRARGQLAEGRQ